MTAEKVEMKVSVPGVAAPVVGLMDWVVFW